MQGAKYVRTQKEGTKRMHMLQRRGDPLSHNNFGCDCDHAWSQSQLTREPRLVLLVRWRYLPRSPCAVASTELSSSPCQIPLSSWQRCVSFQTTHAAWIPRRCRNTTAQFSFHPHERAPMSMRCPGRAGWFGCGGGGGTERNLGPEGRPAGRRSTEQPDMPRRGVTESGGGRRTQPHRTGTAHTVQEPSRSTCTWRPCTEGAWLMKR